MAFVLSLVALLPLISLTTAGPSRVPKCIERANPFDDPCIEDLEADTQSVSLEGRDELALSPSFRTIQFVDTVGDLHARQITKTDKDSSITLMYRLRRTI